MRVASITCLALAATCATAQDLAASAGVMASRVPDARTFGLGLTYTHDLGERFAASLAYRNEGHVPGHHRDGQSPQLWLRGHPISPCLEVRIGAGPYHYF